MQRNRLIIKTQEHHKPLDELFHTEQSYLSDNSGDDFISPFKLISLCVQYQQEKKHISSPRCFSFLPLPVFTGRSSFGSIFSSDESQQSTKTIFCTNNFSHKMKNVKVLAHTGVWVMPPCRRCSQTLHFLWLFLYLVLV